MTACHAVDTDSNSVLGVTFSHFSRFERSASTVGDGGRHAPLTRQNAPPRAVNRPIILNHAYSVPGMIGKGYIRDFNFISQIKYIYLNAVFGVMHVLAKWIESDLVFNVLGALIIGTGILVLAGLALYTSGFLS